VPSDIPHIVFLGRRSEGRRVPPNGVEEESVQALVATRRRLDVACPGARTLGGLSGVAKGTVVLTEHASVSPTRPRARLGAAALLGASLAVASVTGRPAIAQAPSTGTEVAATVEHTAATKVRTLTDPRITESSSLARSFYRKGRLWTANDSGGGTTLYAVGKAGRTVRTFNLTGASHHDWEGMARSVIRGVSYLYVGDIGDNGKKRSSIFVHRVKEPKPGRPSGSLTKYKTYEFRYPDGAHNAEGLMVQPGTHRIFIVSKVKGAEGAIYRAPSTPSTTGVNTLARVRSAPAGMSDAVFLSDGRFVLRGYVNAWLYGSMNAAPRGFALPLKGESITQAWNAKYVFVGSEHQFSSIWRVTLP
jgi:hypothetical protein